MSLVKRTYIDGETVITADNLNDIQDAIIENEEAIEQVESDITTVQSEVEQLDSDFEQFQQNVQADQDAQDALITALKTENDRQNMEIQFLKESAEGVTLHIENSATTNYEKPIPAYTSGEAKLADIKKIGGKTEVKNQLVDLTSVSSGTSVGVSYTVDPANGTVTLNGTSTSAGMIALTNKEHPISGHKVYFGSLTDEGSLETYQIGSWNPPLWQPSVTYNKAIKTIPTGTIRLDFRINILQAGVTFSNVVLKPFFTDLTLRFGSGNEPTSITDERILAIERELDEDPSFVGSELVSADVEQIESSSGKNIFDSRLFDADVGSTVIYVHFAVPNGTYVMSTPDYPIVDGITNVFFLSGKVSSGVSSSQNGVSKTTHRSISVSDGYFTVAYRSTEPTNTNNPKYFKWQIERNAKTDYEPHIIDTRTIPQALRTDHPLKSAGTAHDEWNFVTKKGNTYIKEVDISTLPWYKNASLPVFDVVISDMKRITSDSDIINAICKEAVAISYSERATKTGHVMYYETTNQQLAFRNFDYATAEAFKTAMSGVKLIYELKEPIEYDISSYLTDFNSLLSVENGGSLTFVQDETYLQVPNTEDIYYILGGAS